MTDAEPQIYLASRSPRRRELLSQIGVRFAVAAADCDETRHPGEHPEDYVLRLALEKTRRARARLPGDDPRPVLGADTAVVVGERILGKPTDLDDSLAMLGLLSGRCHRVLTAVALIAADGERTDLSESRVTFRTLTQDECLRYWATGEPRDKAGGYGIQGLGALFIAGLTGSYSGVMGLPLFETARLLGQAGIELIPPTREVSR
ncbi:Maf family protein [Candidatus Thiodictyon syntrophicum]|jgi:septum formation protein|uniref:dTTP/UTP pyrophosphatase n=1 Tax=Candidatus Thiodictyon syntrophicum TaxID=1166950 RepID=A0A2K8U501_9GAMM|nr:nucleoside triphosphate pyrophosphatase [Candidatus Thiodictyon syntrophicum]AUB80469.1 septum formation protein Maf [Candidatus Thiodictyon syntrophicum]